MRRSTARPPVVDPPHRGRADHPVAVGPAVLEHPPHDVGGRVHPPAHPAGVVRARRVARTGSRGAAGPATGDSADPRRRAPVVGPRRSSTRDRRALSGRGVVAVLVAPAQRLEARHRLEHVARGRRRTFSRESPPRRMSGVTMRSKTGAAPGSRRRRGGWRCRRRGPARGCRWLRRRPPPPAPASRRVAAGCRAPPCSCLPAGRPGCRRHRARSRLMSMSGVDRASIWSVRTRPCTAHLEVT